jgi:hypothetical protein
VVGEKLTPACDLGAYLVEWRLLRRTQGHGVRIADIDGGKPGMTRCSSGAGNDRKAHRIGRREGIEGRVRSLRTGWHGDRAANVHQIAVDRFRMSAVIGGFLPSFERGASNTNTIANRVVAKFVGPVAVATHSCKIRVSGAELGINDDQVTPVELGKEIIDNAGRGARRSFLL